MSEQQLFVAREGATFDINGQPIFVNTGDIAEYGSPVLASHMYLFEPMRVKFPGPVKAERAEPERPAQLKAPANPVKASQAGARSR